MTTILTKIFFQRVCLILFLCSFTTALSAQNAPDVSPENEAQGDTTHQKDLLDVYKGWFKLPPKPKNPRPENKVYFTLNPLSHAPTSSGNALVTSTTAN